MLTSNSMNERWILLGVILGFLLGGMPLESYAQGTQGGLADLQRATTGSPQGSGSPPSPSSPSSPPPTSSVKTEPFAPKVLAEWHIEKNLCPGYLSYEELTSLFPTIETEMVQQVCGQ